jgi:hypothetical protein
MKKTAIAFLAFIAIVAGGSAETTKQVLEKSPSTTVTSASSDPVFSKDRVADCKVPCLNNVVVPIFRTINATGLRQFYVHPKPIINRNSLNAGLEEVRAAVKAMGKNAGADQRYTLRFSVSLMHTQIYDELAADLRSRFGGDNNAAPGPANFSDIKPSEIAILPYDTIQITAECGKTDEERTIHSDPNPGSVQANINFKVTDRPTQLNVSLSGTQEELEAFAAAPVMHVYTTSGAYSVMKNFVVVAAEKFLKSNSGQKLTGADKLQNELHVKSTSSGGGFAVSLPFVGGGAKKTDNDTDTQRIIQRWVSRDQVLDETSTWTTNLSVTEWEEIAEKGVDEAKKASILKQLVEFVLADQKSAAFKFEQLADNKLKLTNQVTKEVSVHAGSIATMKLDSKPKDAIEADHEGKFGYGGVEVADKGSFKLASNNEVAFLEQGSYGFVPTTVKLYQISELDLRSRVVANYAKFVSTKNEFQLHSESAGNVEVYDSNISAAGLLGIASLATLESNAKALKAELDSVRKALGAPPAEIKIANIRVSGDSDNGSRNLTCPSGTYVSGISFGYNKGGRHGIVHHVLPICKPFLPEPEKNSHKDALTNRP